MKTDSEAAFTRVIKKIINKRFTNFKQTLDERLREIRAKMHGKKSKIGDQLRGRERLEQQFVQLGFGSRSDEVDLEGKCLWVPANVRHDVSAGSSRFVYGGVCLNPKVTQLDDAHPKKAAILRDVFGNPEQYQIDSAHISGARNAQFYMNGAAIPRDPDTSIPAHYRLLKALVNETGQARARGVNVAEMQSMMGSSPPGESNRAWPSPGEEFKDDVKVDEPPPHGFDGGAGDGGDGGRRPPSPPSDSPPTSSSDSDSDSDFGGSEGLRRRSASFWARRRPTQASARGEEKERDISARQPFRPDDSRNAADALRLKVILALQAANILDDGGQLTEFAIEESQSAMRQDISIRNPAIVRVLTADGSAITDWEKSKTPSITLPTGQRIQVHFYKYKLTGKVNYANADFKVKGSVHVFSNEPNPEPTITSPYFNY
jgi:hypothetical protein